MQILDTKGYLEFCGHNRGFTTIFLASQPIGGGGGGVHGHIWFHCLFRTSWLVRGFAAVFAATVDEPPGETQFLIFCVK